jgi:hypothetical protein
MKTESIIVAAVILAGSSPSFAQDRLPGQKPKQERSACEALAGESKKQCLREERLAKGEARRLGGSCDDLLGPEKERCLKQGGTIEAGAGSNAQERSSTGR